MGHVAEGYTLASGGLEGTYTSWPHFAGLPDRCGRVWIRVGRLCCGCSGPGPFLASGLWITPRRRKTCGPVTFNSLVLTWGDVTPQERFGSVTMHFGRHSWAGDDAVV